MTSSPESWSVTPLGELVEVLDSGRIPVSARERAKRLGSVPYYGAAGQVGWIDKPLFDEPLVLLGEDGVQFFDSMKSKAYPISGPAWVNNHAHVLRARPAVDRRYLLHFLNQFDYRGFANGTTRLKLTQAAMRRMPISCPELKEQLRIVDILEDHLFRLEAAQASLKRSVAAIPVLTLSILRDMRRSLLGSSTPLKPLGAVCDTALGKMLDAKKARGIPTPYLRNISVRWGSFDLTDLKTVPLSDAERIKLEVRPGDLLVCEGGEPGRCAVWSDGPAGMAYQKALHRVRAKDPSKVTTAFVALMLEEYIRTGRADRMFTGTTIKHLPQEKLRVIELPIPDLATQYAAVDRLTTDVQATTRLTSELGRVVAQGAALRRAVLGAAFSGRLSGRTSDIEMVEEMAGV